MACTLVLPELLLACSTAAGAPQLEDENTLLKTQLKSAVMELEALRASVKASKDPPPTAKAEPPQAAQGSGDGGDGASTSGGSASAGSKSKHNSGSDAPSPDNGDAVAAPLPAVPQPVAAAPPPPPPPSVDEKQLSHETQALRKVGRRVTAVSHA